MKISAAELGALLNGTVVGDPTVSVDRPSKIEEGGEGTITFLANPKYESFAYTTTASVILVSKDFEAKKTIQSTLVKVDNVREAVAFLMKQFMESREVKQPFVDDSALIHKESFLGENVSVGAFSVIAEKVKIGAGTSIGTQVFIGENVTIGKNCKLYPGVKIYRDSVIGDNCILHANVVIGSDGFGFAPRKDGSFEKVPQIGNVEIGADVEIGANTSIDCATMGSTRIGKGVKIDNLVQIAHNVEIGDHTVIASQAGIAGSTKIGKNCQIGGQVGFAGHLTIADGSKFQAQSGIASSIKEENGAYFGSPAINYRDYIRSYAVFKKLPDLNKLIYKLSKKPE